VTHPNGDDQKDERLLNALVEELQAMSDTDALDGENAEDLVRLGERLLDAARTEAGRLRMADAKRKLAIVPRNLKDIALPSVAQARMFLESRRDLTLAARNLSELSDDDVLDLFAQAKSLEDASDAGAEDSKE
jgi:hypothetical protein